MKTQKLFGVLAIFVGLAILFYFGRELVQQASKSSTDFGAVVLLLVVWAFSFSLTRISAARTFIEAHSMTVLKVGIAMLLFGLLSPFVFVGFVFFFPAGTANWLPSERAIEVIIFGVAAVGILGFMLAMMPAHIKFSEHIRNMVSAKKRT